MADQAERCKQGAPISSLERIRQELDRWIESAWTQGERTLDAFGIRHPAQGFMPDVDLVETEDEVIVLVDLPGVGADAVQLSLAGNMLTLKGEVPSTEFTDPDVVHARERRTGNFRRFIAMPVAVNADKVTAVAKDGVLRVVLAKAEVAKPKPIHVRTAEKSPEARFDTRTEPTP